MAANYLFGDEGIAPAADGAAEDLRLLRRYEPVLRFTQGELFLPMAVPALPGHVLAVAVGPPRRAFRGGGRQASGSARRGS